MRNDVSIAEDVGERKGPSLEALLGKQSERERERWSDGRLRRRGVSKGKHNGSCDLWRWTSDPPKQTGGCKFRLLPNARLLQYTEKHHPSSQSNTATDSLGAVPNPEGSGARLKTFRSSLDSKGPTVTPRLSSNNRDVPMNWAQMEFH